MSNEPVAWLYTFDRYSEALMPDEVEKGNFAEHPEMYQPLFLAPQSLPAETRKVIDQVVSTLNAGIEIRPNSFLHERLRSLM